MKAGISAGDGSTNSSRSIVTSVRSLAMYCIAPQDQDAAIHVRKPGIAHLHCTIAHEFPYQKRFMIISIESQ